MLPEKQLSALTVSIVATQEIKHPSYIINIFKIMLNNCLPVFFQMNCTVLPFNVQLVPHCLRIKLQKIVQLTIRAAVEDVRTRLT